jgi:hypothetical protein
VLDVFDKNACRRRNYAVTKNHEGCHGMISRRDALSGCADVAFAEMILREII